MEEMIRKIQEAEVTAQKEYLTAVQIQGEQSEIAYAMKHRHAAIRDLMESLGILLQERSGGRQYGFSEAC